MELITVKVLINSTGLVLDIIGAILIFRYGIQPALHKPFHTLQIYELTSINKEQKDKLYNKHKYLSYAGLISLIFGFSLQLISNFI